MRMVHAVAALFFCATPGVPPYVLVRHDITPGEFAAQTLAPRRVNASQIAAFKRPFRRALRPRV